MSNDPHPNAMIYWDAITCQRGHETHQHRRVEVSLDTEHGYGDYPQVPLPLVRSFDLDVWDPDLYPVDGGPYCPAHDAVSETIVSHRIWEPRETILALTVFGDGDVSFLDFGAQLGWFSMLALASECEVVAIDADPENLRLLGQSALANGWQDRLQVHGVRIGPDTEAQASRRFRLAKLDVEGAESDAVRVLWPSIERGLVDHLLVEVSPVFVPGDHYPDLVERIIGAGYRAYTLPDKRRPPVTLHDPEVDLAPYELTAAPSDTRRRIVASWHQEDVWFVHRSASW